MKWAEITQDQRYIGASPEEKKFIQEDWYEKNILSDPRYKREDDTEIRQDLFGERLSLRTPLELPATHREGEWATPSKEDTIKERISRLQPSPEPELGTANKWLLRQVEKMPLPSPEKTTAGMLEEYAGVPIKEPFEKPVTPDVEGLKRFGRRALGVTAIAVEPLQRVFEYPVANVVTAIQRASKDYGEAVFSPKNIWEFVKVGTAPLRKWKLSDNERQSYMEVMQGYNNALTELTGVETPTVDKWSAVAGGIGMRISMPDLYGTIKSGQGIVKAAKATAKGAKVVAKVGAKVVKETGKFGIEGAVRATAQVNRTVLRTQMLRDLTKQYGFKEGRKIFKIYDELTTQLTTGRTTIGAFEQLFPGLQNPAHIFQTITKQPAIAINLKEVQTIQKAIGQITQTSIGKLAPAQVTQLYNTYTKAVEPIARNIFARLPYEEVISRINKAVGIGEATKTAPTEEVKPAVPTAPQKAPVVKLDGAGLNKLDKDYNIQVAKNKLTNFINNKEKYISGRIKEAKDLGVEKEIAIKQANALFESEVSKRKEWIKQGAKIQEEIKIAEEEATKYASREEVAKRKEERRKLEAASTGEVWGKSKTDATKRLQELDQEKPTQVSIEQKAREAGSLDEFVISEKKNAINELRDKIKTKYSQYLPEGTSERVIESTSNFFLKNLSDNKALSRMLGTNNKASRKIFEELTGLKIGKDITLKQIADNEGSLVTDLIKTSKAQLTSIYNKATSKVEKVGKEATYNDYQDVHNAFRRGELKIGDTATVKAYGGKVIEIIAPEYKGEIDALGIPITHRIKSKKVVKIEKPAEVVKADIEEIQKEIPKGTRPIITQSQKESILKKKAIKQKQLTIERADEAKKLVHSMIRDRRFFLNTKNYDTNLFVNSIEQNTSKLQREIIPFILEKTDIPKELNRPDLVKLYEKESNNLRPIASQIKKHFDDSWKFMQEHSDEIPVEQIENYVTHLWEVPKSKKQTITNWFVTQNKFLKKRHIETYKKGIEELGLKPKTLDISEIIRIHDSIMNKVIANKKFVTELKRLTYEGTPLIARIDKAPENWVYFDHPALKQGMVIPGKLQRGEKVSEELKSILNEMGVAIGRRISPVAFGRPTQISGQYRAGETPEIRFQRFFESKTVGHEIGHHLDETLKLGQDFLDKYKDELYTINRDRIESRKGRKGKYGEVYAKSTEEQIAEFFAYVFVKPDIAYQKAPNAMADILGRLKEDDVLSKLIDFDFETKAKNLIEEQLNTMVKLPVRVHPDLEKPLKVIFDSRFDHEIIRAYEAINGILKKSKLSISLFHHLALGETSIATTGLTRTANIYFNPVKIYKAMVKGEFDIFKKEEVARKWIERGLQVGATADIPVARIQRGLNTFKNNTKSIPVLNKLSQFIASFNETWDKGLWNYLHDTLKLYGCEALGAKIDLTKDIVKQEQEIAQMVNDTFGGQNWDMLMVSPKTLQIASWGLLSPDWTISTVRQALSPTGLGAIHKETAGFRRKLGRLFWIKAAIYFGIGINLLNMLYRKKDERDNPKYYKDQKSTFWDRIMTGNSIGHKTHLFVGRYKDGRERYIRWGKQFRELPEMFFDDTGFSPISASLKKIGGKTAPLFQLATIISTGVSPSGFVERNIYGKKGWNRTWGIAKTLIESPLPFSTRSIMQRDKEFKLTDLAMPSSKGMSRYKAINLFKIAIERKDERLFKELWQDCLRNNIPPYDMFKTSLTILKATNTKEINSKIKTLDDIKKAFPLAKTSNERNVLRRKNRRLKKEEISLKNGNRLLKKALHELEKEYKR